MTYRFFTIVSLFLLYSCSSKKGVPGNVLPVNEMKLVMWDMIEADEYATAFIAKDSSRNLKQETLQLYGKVFARYHISGEQLEQSLAFYRTNPPLQKVLLDSLQAYASKVRERNYESRLLSLPAGPDTLRRDTAGVR